MRLLLKFLRIVAIMAGLVVACGIAGVLVPHSPAQDFAGTSKNHRILILSNPIHTDIAIPVDDELRREFDFLPSAGLDFNLDGVRYVIFGWGGRAFYTETPTWSQLKTVPVLKSLTLDRSVMHVELAGEIPVGSAYAMTVNLDDGGMAELRNAVRQTFAESAGAPSRLDGFAYGPYDAFYEANGYFNVIAGCNTWTAAMLRRAGVTTGWWTPLPFMLRLALRLHNGAESLPAVSS
ncbi:TIGR02117 family protein [Rhizobium tumorigenes]|uniref:TIGR02117 family protein n=1 Tax=Rhizobium tumorigenes TaxID=2041385 RepID=A0AAF1KU37_9HYPH|nr:TIGR02117 family protein [Rhizobium tumorigenes]WFR99126.1 TIGR02117 family protein [Rhizobium tumorigenes]